MFFFKKVAEWLFMLKLIYFDISIDKNITINKYNILMEIKRN